MRATRHNRAKSCAEKEEQMNVKELAFEIAQRVIEMEAEIEARGAVLDSVWRRSDSQWQQLSYNRSNEILTSKEIQQRRSELEAAFASANDGDSLLRTLHSE